MFLVFTCKSQEYERPECNSLTFHRREFSFTLNEKLLIIRNGLRLYLSHFTVTTMNQHSLRYGNVRTAPAGGGVSESDVDE